MNNKYWNIVFGIWNEDKLFQSLGPNLSTHTVKYCWASSSIHYWRLKLAFGGNTKEFFNHQANRWTAGPSNTSVSSRVAPQWLYWHLRLLLFCLQSSANQWARCPVQPQDWISGWSPNRMPGHILLNYFVVVWKDFLFFRFFFLIISYVKSKK